MKKLLIILAVGLIITSCNKNEAVECDGTVYSYSVDVAPLLNVSCNTTGCHKSGFASGDFTTHAGVFAKVNNGSLKTRVENGSMPQDGILTLAEKQVIVCWVEAGGLNN
jgi:hypothetical protein